MKDLIRAASSGERSHIQALAKAKGLEGRDPQLYPWAGDQWRRHHWSFQVLDPCIMLKDARKVTLRHVRVMEGFAAKNAKGKVEHPRDSTGRRVPKTQKDIPWPEWLFLTGPGGFPKPMEKYKTNNLAATCIHMGQPQVVVPPPPPPAPTLRTYAEFLKGQTDADLRDAYQLYGNSTDVFAVNKASDIREEIERRKNNPPVPPPPPPPA